MITAKLLSEAIQRYNGTVAFPVDIARIAAPGMTEALVLSYSSNVQGAAQTWNLDAPTGVAGLGWTLELSFIARLPALSVAESEEQIYMAVLGRWSRLFKTGTANDGATLYAPEVAVPWTIRYYPRNERWIITDEYGDRLILGDDRSGRTTVADQVVWANWYGPSGTTSGQQAVAQMWFLSERKNQFGQGFDYTYLVENVAVGSASGATYGQAIYLSEIQGSTGARLALAYGDKEAGIEYVEPHTNPPAPNAYQDTYQTKFLQSVTRHGRTGALVETVTLGYTNGSGDTMFLGTSTLSKRVLTALTQTTARGASRPATKFTYWGEDPTGDKVSATNPYDSSTKGLYGAIKSVLLTTGGTVGFEYTSVTPQYSARDVAIAPPSATSTAPRVTLERDFALTTWLAPGGTSLDVQLYTWDGRWIPDTVSDIPCADAAAYAAMPLSSSNTVAGLFSGGQLHLWRSDPGRAGAWIAPLVGTPPDAVEYFSPALGAGETSSLHAARDFAGLFGYTSGNLFLYNYDGLGWQAQTPVTIGDGGANTHYAVDGQGSVLLVASVSVSSGSTISLDLFAYRSGAFLHFPFTFANQRANSDAISIVQGDGFAVVRSDTQVGPATVSDYAVVQWSADYATLSHSWFTGLERQQTPVISQSTIAIGRTVLSYDGTTWSAYDTDAISYVDQVAVDGFMPGAGVCTRRIQTATDYVYDLIVYDPNTGVWAVPNGMAIHTASANAGVTAALSYGTPSNFAVTDSQIYHKSPDASWAAVGEPMTIESAADAASLTLAGESYAIYQSGSGTADVATKIVPLRNGTVQTVRSLDSQLVSVAGAPANALIGEAAFFTYTGDFTATPSLTLHRLVRDTVTGAQVVYALSSMTIDSGYQTEICGYLYAADYATAQRDGWTGAYQKVSSLAGGTSLADASIGPRTTLYFNGLTAAEADGLSYPTGSSSNAPDYYSYVRGVSYQRSDYSKASPSIDPVRQDTSWWVVTVTPLGTAGQCVYYRQSKIANTVNGATKTTTFDYDANGFVSKAQTSRYNADGREIATIKNYTRWPTIYDPGGTMDAPLLAPIVQTIASTKDLTSGGDGVVYDIQITTWLKSGPAQLETGWAAYKQFMAFNPAPDPFDHWNDPATEPFTPDADGWRQTSVVVSRTDTGLPLETADVDFTRTSRIYDVNDEVALCWSMNASVAAGELSYLGFETYESTAPWQWNGGGTLAPHIVASDRNTGAQCLSIPYSLDASTGPFAAFYPQDQQATYVFGCWVKLSAMAASGSARWQIQAYKDSDHTPVGDPVMLDVTTAGQSWTLFDTAIDLAAIRQQAELDPSVVLYLFIEGGTSVPDCALLVDDLRFSPLKALFGATVYDADILLRTAGIDNTGQVIRTLYNDYYDGFATIGVGERVDEVTLPTFSRALSDADTFLPAFGNTTLTLTTGSSSYYDDFYSAQPNTWQFSGAGWAIETGQLNYTGTTTTGIGATAVYSKQAHTNVGASVEILSRASDADIAVGNGDLYIRWNAANAYWDLVRVSDAVVTQIATNDVVGFRSQVTFVVVDGYAMAFAEGTQLFSYKYVFPSPIPPIYGKLTIAATGNAAFDNVVVLDDPSLSVSTLDAIGRDWQSLDLVGYVPLGASSGIYPAQSGGQFYDALGRPSVMRNPSRGPMEIAPVFGGTASLEKQADDLNEASLLLASPYDNLYVDGGGPLTLEDYLSGSAGVFDYSAQTYDDSPLSRPQQVVLPRGVEQSAADFTVDLTYAGVTALPTTPIPAPQAANGDPALYVSEASSRLFAIDASQTRITVTQARYGDTDGRTLVELATVSDNSVSRMTAFEYDHPGRLITVKQPNYFSPPGGSVAETWQQTRQYTFEGWLNQITDPDTGTTQYLYDRAGRPRFTLTADGAAQTPQRILYTRYDTIARKVEKGVIQDPAYSFADLAAKVDTPGFPEIVASDPTPPLQTIGAWTHKYAYDRNATGAVTNLIGRLVEVSINNGDPSNPDSEQYAYNASGDPISVTTLANSYIANASFTISYDYTSRNQVAKVTYPAPLANENVPFAVGYTYDRLGRLAAVGFPTPEAGVIDPDNPPTPPEMAFAAYGYDDAGRLSVTQLNSPADSQNPVQRMFSYDGEGRLAEVADRYITERFDYDGGTGVDGMRYYTGVIASVSRQNSASALWTCPSGRGSVNRFSYDGLGQLTKTQSDLGWAYTTHYGDGANGYDANGNLLERVHGTSNETFTWNAVSGKRVNNQLEAVNSTITAAASIDFQGIATNARSSGPWSWGSSNLGPSGSAISTDDPHSGTQCLYVAGGGIGHYERLELATYLDPRGSYTLNAFVRTDEGFGAAKGGAAWYLTVLSAGQVLLSAELGTVSAVNNWTAISPITIDLANRLSTLGGDGQSIVISIELRNTKLGSAGATGPGLFIDDITITGMVAGTSYTYDLDGRVTSAPAKGLHQLQYEPVVDRTRLIQLHDAQGDTLNYGFDAGGERLTLRHTDASGAETRSAAVYLRGTGNSPLYAQSTTNGVETALFRVLGLDGLVAYTSDGNWSYVANNWLGSTQLLFDATSSVSGSVAFQSFGDPAETSGDPGTDTLFAGQMLSPQTGLYDFHARLYDADIGRFYATDPVASAVSPYIYAGNNPVINVDPDGRMLAPSSLAFGMFANPTMRRGAAKVGNAALGATIGLASGAARFSYWFITTPRAWLVSSSTFWGSAHLAASTAWETLGFQWLFESAFTDERTRWMKDLELGGGIYNLVQKPTNYLGQLLFNFSRDEYKAVLDEYPGLGPFALPYIWYGVYKETLTDMASVAGGWSNEGRHFFWTGRAARLRVIGNRAFAKNLAAAHETGRPGLGERGFYDTLADKINNVFAWNYASTSNEPLTTMFTNLKDQGLLALNGENTGFFSDSLSKEQSDETRADLEKSYLVSLQHLESEFGEIPEFDKDELAFLEKATGWRPRG